jgi:hypothetical protein
MEYYTGPGEICFCRLSVLYMALTKQKHDCLFIFNPVNEKIYVLFKIISFEHP